MAETNERLLTVRHCLVATAMALVQARNVWRTWWHQQTKKP